jgi:hypothetical protein
MTIYQKRYEKLVNHYKNNLSEGFVEKHHIVPKCMGGSDDISNIVILPPKAHFICHYLLYKMYPDNKSLAFAFSMMCVKNEHQPDRKASGKIYEISKIARSMAMMNVPRTESTKQKLRKPKQNKENYKKPKSDTHRENISNALKNKKKSKEHIEKMCKSQKWYHEKRSAMAQEKMNKCREEYLSCADNLTKKQFSEIYSKQNNISESRVCYYLKGL